MTALMLALAALNTILAIIGAKHAGIWIGDRYLAWRDRHQDPSHAIVRHWPCPDCDQTIPITARPEKLTVMHIDTTDVQAHALTHEGA